MQVNKLRGIVLAAMSVASFSSGAAQWDVTITNLTNGNHFTPLLVTAHDHDTHVFQAGATASLPMQHLAECGHLDPLLASTEVGSVDDDTIANPAGGFLDPGASTMATLTTTATHLSIVAMVLPTNDGFTGLDSQHIPDAAGSYTYYLNAYDAGTEANDEVMQTEGTNCSYTDDGMIPGAPGMDVDSGGTGVSGTDTNTKIHVHRGALGESETTGAGASDLVSTIHRWQNPVAKVVVTVTP